MKLALITGTRPQIIKSAPLLNALQKAGAEVSFIHTGQHYDYELADQFVEEFQIKSPDYNLEIGSGSNTYQTYEIILKLAPILEEIGPDFAIVPGDTNSAFAAALVCFKMEIPVCHLESGLRSFDMVMQEEINRRLIDHASMALFAPTKEAVKNLEEEHVIGTIFQTGDTMYDVLKDLLPKFSTDEFFLEVTKDLELTLDDEFAVLTFHRRENVDYIEKLSSAIEGFKSLGKTILFPMHPRTKKQLDDHGLELGDNVIILKPLPYSSMMSLVSKASLLLTDSGGLQKEAYLLNTPCVTIRDNTEWVETLEAGANILSSVSSSDIVSKANMMWGKKLNNNPSVYGDGKASEKIVEILKSTKIVIKNNIMLE
ncbi:MAG: UDP-N-acetylglucosamine 2-epimerase (non-hydrolyzing) [Candidatus Thorarchaeota archaeon]|nr:UDP-N-acetylglucosamine 2-epimerase (non-hydrolyzing) [Candidatus Thorarchaeota archaeon]